MARNYGVGAYGYGNYSAATVRNVSVAVLSAAQVVADSMRVRLASAAIVAATQLTVVARRVVDQGGTQIQAGVQISAKVSLWDNLPVEGGAWTPRPAQGGLWTPTLPAGGAWGPAETTSTLWTPKAAAGGSWTNH